MIWSKLNSVVGFWFSPCIGVPSAHTFILQTLSKATRDMTSCLMSGGTVKVFGSVPVPRRLATTARIIPPGVESTRMGSMSLRLGVGGNMWCSKPVATLANALRSRPLSNSSL